MTYWFLHSLGSRVLAHAVSILYGLNCQHLDLVIDGSIYYWLKIGYKPLERACRSISP
jgi:hypothetical protein